MLEFLQINRFKTLLNSSFPLANLNLFSGLNGMGKSSVIQVLLLLRQSYERNVLSHRGLLLRGDYVNLGVGQDVLSCEAEVNSMEFKIKWEDQEVVVFPFDYSATSDLQPLSQGTQIPDLSSFSLFNGNFQYLCADRIGPRAQYDVSDFTLHELNSLGIHGEYAIQYIAEYASRPLNIPALQRAETPTLLQNLDAWMSELSPGIRIKASMQATIATLGYAFVHGKDVTADFKPQNVGFGLTYSLPVVAALLRARPGDLLIIENPESHLHPAGQSVVARLCALVAAHGVQLIIESHSDHFLNGIRIAVKEGVLSPERVSIFFLERPYIADKHASIVRSPRIDVQGHLDSWPEGFFDESDKALERLL